MGKLIQILDKYLYPDFKDNWDNILFRNRVLEYVSPESKLLDLGSGAGILTELNFKDSVSYVCGLDLDSRILLNPYLNEAKVGSAEFIPYDNETFDAILCNNVIEHLANPTKVFRAVNRVLKKGGIFIAKTPNKYHYVTLLSKLTPHWFHTFFNRLRGRLEEDTFPTYYRANTRSKILKLAKLTDFEILFIDLIEGRPEYLRISWITYLIGKLYDKIVSSAEFLQHFRIVLIVCLVKK